VSIYSCKMNESVNEEKLQKLKQIYSIIGNKFDNKATEYEWGPSEDTNSVKYQKFKEDMLKNPNKTTYGESGDYKCEGVAFEFFKEKAYDIAINFEEYNFVVDERDGSKYPSGTSPNSIVVEKFNSLELSNDKSILGKWNLDNGENTGTFKFNIDQSKPNTIFFEVTNGNDKKFNATVEISNDKFIKVKEILNDF
jgi:hypothetical protein